MSCHPETCEKNPMNNSRIMSNGFSNCQGSCADCDEFFLKAPFLKDLAKTSTAKEFKDKTIALGG